MLGRDGEDLWLDPDRADPERLLALLRPYPDAAMEVYPVGRRVNSPANDSAELLAPLPAGGTPDPPMRKQDLGPVRVVRVEVGSPTVGCPRGLRPESPVPVPSR